MKVRAVLEYAIRDAAKFVVELENLHSPDLVQVITLP
jgi:hypothetical protein